jgi:DNA-binding CsgD family transcriptional regulator
VKGLSQRDLDGLVEFLGALETPADEPEFAELISSGLRTLMSYDCGGFNDVDARARKVQWVTDPVELGEAGDARKEAFERYMLQHPGIAAFAQRGDGRARRTSDFMSERRFRRTDIYNEFYKPLELEHHLVCHWGTGPAHYSAISLFRTQGDFSERDRALLGLLRPYLALGQRTVQAQAQARCALGLFEDALWRSGQGLVTLTRGDRIDATIGWARELLAGYFDADGRVRLPDELAGWTQIQRRRLNRERELPTLPGVFAKEGDQGRLLVQYLPATADQSSDALLLSQETRFPDSNARLTALGLTPRETEILRMVAAGHSNQQIAQHLVVTVATVKKHLEHIYRKLDVGSRTAAVAKAQAAARGTLATADRSG